MQLRALISHANLSKWLLLMHFCCWFILSFFISASPDMADHWVWSRSLQLSYYEHPPMIALIFRLFTTLLGNTPMAIKLSSLIVNVLILLIAFRLCKTLFGRLTANIYLLILVSTPYFTAGSMFMHIDQPYMIFWLLNLWFVSQFIKTKNPNWLLAVGVGAGLGALSKYITLLFYISLGVWALIRKEQRLQFFRRPHLYLAGLISLCIFSPVLIWNLQNDWVSFKFQFGRGLSGASFGENLGPFTLGHLTTFSLIFAVYLWVTLFRKKLASREMPVQNSFLLVMGLVPATFFTLTSFRGAIADPHWLNVSYLSLFMLLSQYVAKKIESHNFEVKRLAFKLGGAYVTNVLFISLFFAQGYLQIYKISPELDPVVKNFGWEITARQIDQLLIEKNFESPKFVISIEYQLSGILSLYLSNQPLSFSYQKPERNQWSPLEKVSNQRSITVCPPHECSQLLSSLDQSYNLKHELLGQVESFYKDRPLRTLKVYKVLN